MEPTTERAEQKADVEDTYGQMQFIRQVDDDSLPAAEVLAQQKQGREAQHAAPLFVP